MPIQDGKYVSPDWSNSSPPPINASELNALSETVEKADTNYTRDEILSDEVKQLIGLETTDTPNDAFSRITLGNKRYGINLYVKFQNDSPVSGVTITSSGSPPISGSMVTDENGYLFLAQNDTSFTASIDNANGKIYIDCVENPSVSQTLSDTITTINMTWNFNEEVQQFNSSKTVTFSDFVTTFDACAVGGGGGGGGNRGCGGGGGGGYVTNVLAYKPQQHKQLSMSIGSGGRDGSAYNVGVNEATNGGSSSVTYDNSIICTANGGRASLSSNMSGNGAYGGSGNGPGGNGGNQSGQDWHGKNGVSSTDYIFNEQSLGLAGGGGGGGGSTTDSYNPLPAQYVAKGGQPYGASGSCSIYNMSDGSTNRTDAASPTGPGGGGGGESNGGGTRMASASGGHAGCVYLRFHH